MIALDLNIEPSLADSAIVAFQNALKEIDPNASVSLASEYLSPEDSADLKQKYELLMAGKLKGSSFDEVMKYTDELLAKL